MGIVLAADPLTAALNFLCTPAGQTIAVTIEKLIVDIIKAIHDKHAAPPILAPVLVAVLK